MVKATQRDGHTHREMDGPLLSYGPQPLVEIPSPASPADTDLPASLLEELTLKGIYYLGRPTAHELTQELMLPFSVVEAVLNGLKADGLCEVVGSQGFGQQAYAYTLTDQGRGKVNEFVSRRQYFGPAPVPLAQYLSVMHQQCRDIPVIDRSTLLKGLEHLVVNERMIGMLGPAVNSREPILFYGPPGNGKTSLALALGNVMAGQDPIWVPHVVYAAGQLIKVFDPAVHEPVRAAEELDAARALAAVGRTQDHDRRWVLIQRPLVVGGGEYTLSRFEFSWEPTSNVYFAPDQWKATGGTLLIDDLGRQTARPHDLLNRWIIPLEKHKDYLTLRTGQTLEIPLSLLLIFATNLQPDQLLDEAYLRRLPYRILVANPSPEQYRRIFRAACAAAGLAYDPETVDYLFRTRYEDQNIEMRACHPQGLIARVLDIGRFQGQATTLSPDLVDQAAALYFSGPFQTGSSLASWLRIGQEPQAPAPMRAGLPASPLAR